MTRIEVEQLIHNTSNYIQQKQAFDKLIELNRNSIIEFMNSEKIVTINVKIDPKHPLTCTLKNKPHLKLQNWRTLLKWILETENYDVLYNRFVIRKELQKNIPGLTLESKKILEIE